MSIMQKRDYKGYLFLLTGLMILSLGFSLVITAGYGNDTISVLSEGIAKQTGLTIGNGSQIISLLAMVLVLFLNYKLIKLGTVITTFSIGFFLDLFLRWIPDTELSVVRIVLLMIGILFAGIGIGITVISGKGASPVDSLMLAINQRFHISITASRIVLDVVLIASGFLLGGSVGIATIVCVVTLGPIVAFTIEKMKRFGEKTEGVNQIAK